MYYTISYCYTGIIPYYIMIYTGIILHCTILYYTILYYTHYTILYYTGYTILYHTFVSPSATIVDGAVEEADFEDSMR